MNWKTPVYWTIAFVVGGLILLAIGSVDQPLQVFQLGNNSTGVTP
jgi:hypothetical protein